MPPLGQQRHRPFDVAVSFVATSLVSCSKAEVVECPVRNPCWSEAGIKCVLTVVSMRASITFASGKSSEIGRYEVPREESLPSLGIGMTMDESQIAGIRHDVTESLNSAVRYISGEIYRLVNQGE